MRKQTCKCWEKIYFIFILVHKKYRGLRTITFFYLFIYLFLIRVISPSLFKASIKSKRSLSSMLENGLD